MLKMNEEIAGVCKLMLQENVTKMARRLFEANHVVMAAAGDGNDRIRNKSPCIHDVRVDWEATSN